jgi:hypothetical protein
VGVERFSQYAVDAAVFREVERITGADPDSFVGLGRNDGRDARRAHGWARPIDDADVAAFVAVGDLYARDGRRVHSAGEPLAGADPARLVDPSRRATPHDAEDRSFAWRRGERLADRRGARAGGLGVGLWDMS